MTTIQSLMASYQERTKELHQEDFNRRMNHGREVRKLIYVRAIGNGQHIPFTTCPGEKRVRIKVDEICVDYVVCDKATGEPLYDWSITLT